MAPDPPPDPGWAVTGFQAVMVLWAWSTVVLLHVFWRCLARGDDPIRPAGPIP
jgi:hypothetical protein